VGGERLRPQLADGGDHRLAAPSTRRSGGGFGALTIMTLIYPILLLILLNSVFAEGLRGRRPAGRLRRITLPATWTSHGKPKTRPALLLERDRRLVEGRLRHRFPAVRAVVRAGVLGAFSVALEKTEEQARANGVQLDRRRSFKSRWIKAVPPSSSSPRKRSPRSRPPPSGGPRGARRAVGFLSCGRQPRAHVGPRADHDDRTAVHLRHGRVQSLHDGHPAQRPCATCSREPSGRTSTSGASSAWRSSPRRRWRSPCS
jgi:hypothetical protein